MFVPKFRHARVFVHFHSFSCVATLTSSMTRGTQPPKTNILQEEDNIIASLSLPSTGSKSISQSQVVLDITTRGLLLVCDGGGWVETAWKGSRAIHWGLVPGESVYQRVKEMHNIAFNEPPALYEISLKSPICTELIAIDLMPELQESHFNSVCTCLLIILFEM